ncbi:hypothetical protein COO60DRAFT_460441 [Scenedesmus sp. NREL 46B-D3]|nr:hypothetical protein COO60DRAFT_460441 [Scenedesmus sp. NREL 46B-D3]
MCYAATLLAPQSFAATSLAAAPACLLLAVHAFYERLQLISVTIPFQWQLYLILRGHVLQAAANPAAAGAAARQGTLNIWASQHRTSSITALLSPGTIAITRACPHWHQLAQNEALKQPSHTGRLRRRLAAAEATHAHSNNICN